MDRNVSIGLLLTAAIAFIASIEFLFVGAVIVFIALTYAERLAPIAPSAAGKDFAFQQPVIIQSNMHSAGQSFYTSLINNVVQDALKKH